MIDEKKLKREDLCTICNSADCTNCFSDENFRKWIDEQLKVGEWIPINDRLPTLGTWNIVTIKNHLMGGRKELRYPVIYMEKMYDVGYGFYENGIDILMPEYSEITAWQPLPEPWEGGKE